MSRCIMTVMGILDDNRLLSKCKSGTQFLEDFKRMTFDFEDIEREARLRGVDKWLSLCSLLPSVLEDLVDPVPELWYPGVDPGLVPLSTPDAPADDAPQHEPPVLPLHAHRAAAVPLAVNSVTNITQHIVRVPCHGSRVNRAVPLQLVEAKLQPGGVWSL